ncbi:hypothetical protein pb186bvf_010972 [Paramecium bursaria]
MNKDLLLTDIQFLDIVKINPRNLNPNNIYRAQNFGKHIQFIIVNGQWVYSENQTTILDPLNGDQIIQIPDKLVFFLTQLSQPKKLKYLDNQQLNVQNQASTILLKILKDMCYMEKFYTKQHFQLDLPFIEDYFVELIQRVAPKSDPQARGEVKVTQRFLMNFSGDQCRFLTRSFNVSGDHFGQQSSGYRFPFGTVAIISPFNFPLEIPASIIDRMTIKADQRVAVVLEAFIRLLHHCGLPLEDVRFDPQ